MMSLAAPVKRYTPQEYYVLERVAHYKSDYYDGEIIAMSGGTIRHSLVITNIVGELRRLLKGKPCAPYESNLRLRITSTGLRCYPDATVFCQPFEHDPEDSSRETVTNPTLIFEVLSESTEGYDRGTKARSYRTIESLQAYVMVSQESAMVEIHERQANGDWVIHEANGISEVISLPAIGIELPLAEIYDRVEFSAAET